MLLDGQKQNIVKEKVVRDILLKMKNRREEMNMIEKNCKSIIVYKGSNVRATEDNKYDTKQTRIYKFRCKNKKCNVIEDLTRAIVPYKNHHREKVNKLKRMRNEVLELRSNINKKRKSDIIKVRTLVVFDNKITDNECYNSRELRIKKFRNKKKILRGRKEDLSKSIVPYRKKARRKRPGLKVKLDNIKKKKRKNAKKVINTPKIFKGEVKINTRDIMLVQSIKHIRLNFPEDLSKALVPYELTKLKIFNKARKRKRKIEGKKIDFPQKKVYGQLNEHLK